MDEAVGSSDGPGPGQSRRVIPSAAPELSFPMFFWETISGVLTGKSPGQHPHQKESRSRTSSTVDAATLESNLRVLQKSSHPGAMEVCQALQTQVQIFVSLLPENEQLQCNQQDSVSQPSAERRLQQKVQAQEAQIAQLEDEVQWLQQELKEAKRCQKSGDQKSNSIMGFFSQSATGFPVQVLATGQTGGCERQFLDAISKLLSNHRIHLRVENYREDSGRFLLVFCPIASQIGADIRNALEKLSRVPKALLVVLHYKQKDNSRFVADTTMQAKHPAVVQTIHACYTVQEGFCACQMNEEAVATAAKIIKDLSREG